MNDTLKLISMLLNKDENLFTKLMQQEFLLIVIGMMDNIAISTPSPPSLSFSSTLRLLVGSPVPTLTSADVFAAALLSRTRSRSTSLVARPSSRAGSVTSLRQGIALPNLTASCRVAQNFANWPKSKIH